MTVETGNGRGEKRGNVSGAIERLYVLVIAGGLVGLLGLVVLTFFTSGKLTEHAAAITALTERISALQGHIAELKRANAALSRTASPPAGDASSNGGASGRSAANARDGAKPRPRGAAPRDAEIRLAVNRYVRPAADGLYETVDERGANSLLARAVKWADRANWSGQSWLSLAILARLLDDERFAARCASAADASGQDTSPYDEYSARVLLIANRPAESRLFADSLARHPHKRSIAALLRSAAMAAERDLGGARRALAAVDEQFELSPSDRLRLGRVYMELSMWPELGRVLSTLGELSGPTEREGSLLRAALLLSQRKFTAALAILDILLEGQPSDYEALTWRGAALLDQRQFMAARKTLSQATEVSPGRPEAFYQLGVLEARDENLAQAEQHLHQALAASARYVPAWEALATLQMNAGKITEALAGLEKAVQWDSGRASAYFLIAICQAKLSRREETRQALQAAFALDAALLEQSLDVETIARLFSRSELQELIAPPAASQPAASQPESSPAADRQPAAGDTLPPDDDPRGAGGGRP